MYLYVVVKGIFFQIFSINSRVLLFCCWTSRNNFLFYGKGILEKFSCCRDLTMHFCFIFFPKHKNRCISVMHHMPKILSMLLKINPCEKTLIQTQDNLKSISSRMLKCLVVIDEGFYHISSSKNKLNSCYKVWGSSGTDSA